MAGADGNSPGAAAERLRLREQRVLNPEPFLKVQAASLEERISNAFRDEKSPAGEAWPPLAPATIEHRLGKLPGANRRGKSGKLTAGARQKRDAARSRVASGGRDIKKLVDTGRLRAGITVRVADGNTIVIGGPAYLAAHVTGTADIPKRNPLPIEVRPQGGASALVPDAAREFGDGYVRFIETGRAR